MTADPIDLLRSIDPLPDGSSAPPVQRLLARIDAAETPPEGRRSPDRWRAWMVSVLGVAAAVAVVAVVVVAALGHRRATPAHSVTGTAQRVTPSAVVPSAQSLDPAGGMPGMLLVTGAWADASRQTVSFTQCQPCYAGGEGKGTSHQDWMLTSTDGGASWRAARDDWAPMAADFAGRDAWGEGVLADGPDGGFVRYFVSHDGGAHWRVALGAVAPPGFGGVSIAGGEAWSVGSTCQAGVCTDVIQHGPAAGDHLTPTAAQPPLDGSTNARVFAVAHGDVYVTIPMAPNVLYRSTDDGRSWHRLARPCPAALTGAPVAAGDGALWDACGTRSGATVIRRSADGGRHWQTMPGRLPESAQFSPESPTVAWLLTTRGQLLRTADGGRTWTAVWYGGRPEPVQLAGRTPVLMAQNATVATVVAVVTRGRVDGHARRTNFVVYRTTDGGRTWRAGAVRLPAG